MNADRISWLSLAGCPVCLQQQPELTMHRSRRHYPQPVYHHPCTSVSSVVSRFPRFLTADFADVHGLDFLKIVQIRDIRGFRILRRLNHRFQRMNNNLETKGWNSTDESESSNRLSDLLGCLRVLAVNSIPAKVRNPRSSMHPTPGKLTKYHAAGQRKIRQSPA